MTQLCCPWYLFCQRPGALVELLLQERSGQGAFCKSQSPSVREGHCKGEGGRERKGGEEVGEDRQGGVAGREAGREGGMFGRKAMKALRTLPVRQTFPMHPGALGRPILWMRKQAQREEAQCSEASELHRGDLLSVTPKPLLGPRYPCLLLSRVLHLQRWHSVCTPVEAQPLCWRFLPQTFS